jgi:hypothetical protein
MSISDPEKQFWQAQNQAREAIAEMICAELDELIEQGEITVIARADQLTAAYEAVQQAKQPVDDIDREIQALKIKDRDMQDRHLLSTYPDEIRALETRRQKLLDELQPFLSRHEEARKALTEAEAKQILLELNKEIPFGGHGINTRAFRLWTEAGGLNLILLAQMETHPNWQLAKDFLDELCYRSGHYPQAADINHIQRAQWDREWQKANPHQETTVHSVGIDQGIPQILSKQDLFADDLRGKTTYQHAVNPEPPAYKNPPRASGEYKTLP